MGLNEVASGERTHIAFFGLRNAGKSSLVNALTGLDLAVVSDVKGTTTDPVKKAMELLPLGPVVIIDTPGLDDEGELGQKRVEKAIQVLNHTDIAVLVVDSALGITSKDLELIEQVKSKKLPYIVAFNKSELSDVRNFEDFGLSQQNVIYVSAKNKTCIYELKEKLGEFAGKRKSEKSLLSDLVKPGSIVVLVIPIDESAPKSRIIMPQQMAIRDLLDSKSMPVCCQVSELPRALELLRERPALVVTDSQAFEEVSKIVPEDVPLTSFSILMARYKGNLNSLSKGASALKNLKDGDRVLIAEGCVHHRQCNDIGTVKMPHWIEAYSGAKPEYEFSSGGDFPIDLSKYKLIVHCGCCMLNEAEMQNRIARAEEAGVPIVNYGMAIAQMQGILDRSLKPLQEVV